MAPETRHGDPAFAGDDRITHEPVVEEERESPLPSGGSLRRPLPWAVLAVVLAFVVTAVVAGVAVGGSYVIPFVVLAGLILGFLAFQRWLNRTRSDDADDPIPNIGFDGDTPLGATDEQSDAEGATGRG